MKDSCVLLACYATASVGLGHLTRLVSLAQEIKKNNNIQIELLVFGETIARNDLADFNATFFPLSDEFESVIRKKVKILNPTVLVFDLCPRLLPNNLEDLFSWLQYRDTKLVSIDSLTEYCNLLDLVWVPSFYFDFKDVPACAGKIRSGWDSFLIQKRLPSTVWKKGSRVLVLTGGGDVTRLGNTLPAQLDALLNEQSEIHWVRGPYSEAPLLPDKPRLNWNIHNAPTQLDDLIVQSNYVLTVFGVAFFEVLQYGVPTVVFSPYDNKDDQELIALAEEKVAVVAENEKTAILNIIMLMHDDDLAKACSEKALEKLSVNGAQKLAEAICLMAGV